MLAGQVLQTRPHSFREAASQNMAIVEELLMGVGGRGGTISKVLAMQAWGPQLDPLLLYYQFWEEEIRRFLRSAGQAGQPN